MKTYYTEKEIKRMATEKAIEILQENKDMILTNTSYGGYGMGEVLIGLENKEENKSIYIGFENVGDWFRNERQLIVVKNENGNREVIEKIMTVYEISRNIKGYLTREDDYNKHIARECLRYEMRESRRFKEYHLGKDSKIAKKLISRIAKETGKNIKPQSLNVKAYKGHYSVYYYYRNIEKAYIINK